MDEEGVCWRVYAFVCVCICTRVLHYALLSSLNYILFVRLPHFSLRSSSSFVSSIFFVYRKCFRKLAPYFTFELLLYNLDFITNVAVIDLQISVSYLSKLIVHRIANHCKLENLAKFSLQIFTYNCIFLHRIIYLLSFLLILIYIYLFDTII